MLIASNAPPGSAVLFTGGGFDGFLSDGGAHQLRSWIRRTFSFDGPLVTCNQVHGTDVRRTEPTDQDWLELENCDAVWTDRRPQSFAIKVADCVATLAVDPSSGVAAGVHAGWRGASAGIVPKTIGHLREQSSFDPAQALAWIGPAIRVCCFEVGEEVIDAVLERVPEAEQWVDRTRGEKPHLDLAAVVRADLVRAGVPDDNISDSGVCTRCDESFHSYRRSGANSGRNLGVVALGNIPAEERA